jgi:hypothetical protein
LTVLSICLIIQKQSGKKGKGETCKHSQGKDSLPVQASSSPGGLACPGKFCYLIWMAQDER